MLHGNHGKQTVYYRVVTRVGDCCVFCGNHAGERTQDICFWKEELTREMSEMDTEYEYLQVGCVLSCLCFIISLLLLLLLLLLLFGI